MTRGWTDLQKARLADLRKSGDRFFSDQIYEAPDRPADMSRLAFDSSIEDDEQDGVVASLVRLEHGEYPRTSDAAEQAKSEHSLNLAYLQAVKSLPLSIDADPLRGADAGDLLTQSQLRNSERAWMAYREAWIAFAGVRYPKVSAGAIRKWLTDQRTKELLKIATNHAD